MDSPPEIYLVFKRFPVDDQKYLYERLQDRSYLCVGVPLRDHLIIRKEGNAFILFRHMPLLL